MLFKVFRVSSELVESNIGLLYGNPNGTTYIELDTLEELVSFAKEQNSQLIIKHESFSIQNPLIIIEDE